MRCQKKTAVATGAPDGAGALRSSSWPGRPAVETVRSCAWPAPLPVHVAGVAAVTGMSLVVGLAGETYAYRPDAARHANPRYTDIAIVPESIGSMLTVVMLPAVPHTRPYRYGTRMRI